MKRVIWKFPLETMTEQTISLPVGSKILTVQWQINQPCLWAEVDASPDTVRSDYHITMVGTGHEFMLYPTSVYISTVILNGGSFVLHFYYR
jgi:hypothetical protein